LSEEAVRAIFEHWAKKTIAARGCPHVKVICFDEITLHKGNHPPARRTGATDSGKSWRVAVTRRQDERERRQSLFSRMK
jgi:hypothetical protein